MTEIQSASPELVELRINGTRTISAITDRDLFIQQMKEKGAELKDDTLEGENETEINV